MSSDYSYDEQGQFFPVFILTLTGLVTLPLTYTLLFPAKDIEAKAPRIQSDFKPEHEDLIQARRDAQKRKQRRVKRALRMLIPPPPSGRPSGGFRWSPIWLTRLSPPLLQSATEKMIKSKYRKLSRTLHPDKVKPNAAKNETIESLNDAYVEISKAYQALTDEEVRNNYIQYGHPDGKQSFSIGIALPPWIISDGNGKYVVVLYTLLLGVLLPYLVGSWWYGTQRMSKEGVLMESANDLFRAYEDNIDTGGVITALSAGKEYDETFKGDKADSGLASIESRIATGAGLTTKDKHALEDLDNGPQSAMSPPPGTPSTHLIQAMPPKSSPLLQLPHFTSEIAQAVDGDAKTHVNVQQFMELPDAQRRSLTVGSSLLTDAQYKTAVGVAKQLPHLQVNKAFFKVTGEKFIIPSSLVTLVVKGRIIPPGSENVPEVNELDLEDVDPAEDDLEAYLGRAKAVVKGPEGKPVAVDKKPVLPPLAHAPYFARDHAPKWSVFLSDSKQGKMAVPPFHFTQFDQPIFDSDGKPTFNMQTLKAQFAAPPQAGHYTFVMHLVCDSYVGFDTQMEVTLVVEEASKAAAMAAEDEISEPDEDSLAGQMNALKGGAPPAAKPRRKQVVEESDDESGTDDDQDDDDTSATNTDTEDES
ncbi:translocation protein sec63 [Verticillium alfalfae VaMs.102]|uniref:Translocation protein sec63 n=1 Tax=Verticillium alfalfae (strain VaMs.102 / ATCC MYA-4576 / FGSC 10136) TaxID=526221 RepID=C9SEE1_VERA1|nr:translocation protein sec63 [Verticillium alfalfae VaMs.102]EEY16534.1 translocation protein sec63 [Verticillium alfalfae VaMs.102]